MNTQNRNIFCIFCLVSLLSGCSNQPSIQSAKPGQLEIRATEEQFVEAYYLAQTECQKDAKNAKYIPDRSTDLKILAFNCEGEDVAVVTATEEAPEEVSAEEPMDMEVETETVTEEESSQ